MNAKYDAQEPEELTPPDAVERMSFPGRSDIYVLNGGYEKRMSTISQQYRAISLIGALIENGTINPEKPEQKIAIIGGGIAGLTAAAVALWRGCKNVTVYEKNADVATTFAGSTRLIDPRLYEWPKPDWIIKDSQLPLLNWAAEEGSKVTQAIKEQWEGWKIVFGEKTAGKRLKSIEKEISSEDILEQKGFLYDRKILKIVAVGFGEPKSPTDFVKDDERKWEYDYWNSPLDIKESEQIGIIGAGDGGLTEAIEHCFIREAGETKEGQVPWMRQADLRNFLEKFEVNLGPVNMENLRKALQENERAELRGTVKAAFDSAIKEAGFRLRKKPSPVLLFVRKKQEPKNLKIKKSAPFLLNQWLAAHLERNGRLQRVVCEDFKKKILTHVGNGKYKITTTKINGKRGPKVNKVDRLFIRMGQELVTGWEDFLKGFRENSRAGQEKKQKDTFAIARRPPAVPAHGTRCFYSDLFDSPTQRAVLDALKKECGDLRGAEAELVRLYERRFLLEVARRDKVLLSDNQVFDGAFFLRWLPSLSDDMLKALAPTVQIGIRKPSPEWVFDAFVSNGEKAREFEFSAIVDKSHRDEITRLLKEKSRLQSWRDMDRYLRDKKAHRAVIEAWETLVSYHNRLIWTLNRPCSQELLKDFKFGDIQMDHRSALDDPGEFVQKPEHEAAADLVAFAFGINDQGKMRSRSEVYRNLDEAIEKNNVPRPTVEAMRDWYDRGYSRGIGFQHASVAGRDSSSMIFETVRTEGLRKFNPRDGDPAYKISTSTTPLFQEDRHYLLGLRPTWETFRHCGTLLALAWPERATPLRIRTDGISLGPRALALLRGSDQMTRLWTEEATQVGPRVPAVIDEEYLENLSEEPQGGNKEVKLNRVEYFGDI